MCNLVQKRILIAKLLRYQELYADTICEAYNGI